MPQTPTIRVLIADRHSVVRSALSALLMVHADLECVGEAADAEQALRLCKRQQPDVVLMDLIMPHLDGIRTTRAIRACCPRTQVVILTTFPDEQLAQAALDAGAAGYWYKDITGDELTHILRAAYHGQPGAEPRTIQA